MTDEELKKEAIKYAVDYPTAFGRGYKRVDLRVAYIAGAKEHAQQWHKIFTNSTPYNYEYWDLPQETLPQIENFYYVKLKNGFIKICELKYDVHSKKKYFYDLHGGKQSDVAEWLDYPKE